MPSKIEKLIAKWRGKENHAVGNLAERFRCADELERAYREEVVPVVNALLAVKAELRYAHPVVYEIVAEALRPFDAPAPEEPKQ